MPTHPCAYATRFHALRAVGESVEMALAWKVSLPPVLEDLFNPAKALLGNNGANLLELVPISYVCDQLSLTMQKAL